MPRGGKREGAGRPAGNVRKQRQFRLHDDEYEKVKEFIKQMKAEKPAE